MFIQLGCKTSKIPVLNCESYIKDSFEDSDYDAWEDCLIEKSIKTKTKKQLYNDIEGNLIQYGILVGFSGEVSQSYVSSKALTKILTDKEISKNLHSKDMGIKYNSFYTIALRNKQDVFEALKFVLNDTTRVFSQYGCLIDELTFADLCINLVVSDESDCQAYQLDQDEIEELDSLVIARNLNLQYRDWMKK